MVVTKASLISNTDISSWACVLLVVKSLEHQLLTSYKESCCGIGLWDSGTHESDRGLWTLLSSLSSTLQTMPWQTKRTFSATCKWRNSAAGKDSLLSLKAHITFLRTLKWGNTEPDEQGQKMLALKNLKGATDEMFWIYHPIYEETICLVKKLYETFFSVGWTVTAEF